MTRSSFLLASRIRGEVGDLERVVDRALRSWTVYRPGTESAEAYLDSVAFNLHGMYAGIERLIELIVRDIDDEVPTAGAGTKISFVRPLRSFPRSGRPSSARKA